MKKIRKIEIADKSAGRDYCRANPTGCGPGYNFLGIRGRSQSEMGHLESSEAAPSRVRG